MKNRLTYLLKKRQTQSAAPDSCFSTIVHILKSLFFSRCACKLNDTRTSSSDYATIELIERLTNIGKNSQNGIYFKLIDSNSMS